MKKDVCVALDVMGGDHGPSVVVPAAAIALVRRPDLAFRLYGDEKLIAPLLSRHQALAAKSRVVHCEVAVKMTDRPSQALRSGRRASSMWRAIEAVKKGDADCVVSAGNTGALMAMAKMCLHMLPLIERPAAVAMWPTLRGESIVLDVGATIGADARHLTDLAIMGAAMARIVFDIECPTVGLSMSNRMRAIAAPMIARSIRCCASAPIVAPTSSTIDSPRRVGHIAAIAGRSIGGSICRHIFAIAISAPVLPAETTQSASPFFTASIARHIEDVRRPDRNAWLGLSVILTATSQCTTRDLAASA